MTLFADPYYVCEQGHLESIKHSCDFTEYFITFRAYKRPVQNTVFNKVFFS